LKAADLAEFRSAIDALLDAHLPYPALIFDAHSTVVQTNAACAALFGVDVTGRNCVGDFLTDPRSAALVDNWPQVAWAGLDRLRADVDRSPFDMDLAQLLRLAESALAAFPGPKRRPRN
jgi:hypothetical protein